MSVTENGIVASKEVLSGKRNMTGGSIQDSMNGYLHGFVSANLD
jgi:hypothetical protein